MADGSWVRAGTFSEVGPIARDEQAIRLPAGRDPAETRLRLSMTRGYWRLDRVALAKLGPAIEPIVVEPRRVVRSAPDSGAAGAAGEPGTALATLRDADAWLATYPGDAYEIEFELPSGPHELFLATQGYYYEWIRAEWLPEEDPDSVVRALTDPARTLRDLAPAYKAVEADMEEASWNSRFSR